MKSLGISNKSERRRRARRVTKFTGVFPAATRPPLRYHKDVRRTAASLLFLALAAYPQTPKERKTQEPAPKAEPAEPPEEDESVAPKQYTFNPLEATHDVTIGNYYFKKKNYRAAAKRYTEATRWNPGMAEAYLLLGETQEKLHDPAAARAAYAKYVELAPDAKNAELIRKKLTSQR